ncbi:MAG TPA: hypothetical protein VKV29_02980 [Chthonomonas sp.]|uniref:hypothetical protein n=1 Tax=Chthonomonas sp. TaxID=2282153 RepID=UPI002B4B3996|nr:hypothetical protein [Chthonomonas sp.]HLH79228.1 hypothetical protein [Chthonomonas sp.]
MPTADAIALPQRFQEEMDADFLARLHESAILAAMTPEERLRHLKEVMYVCGIDDPLFCQEQHIDPKKDAEYFAKETHFFWCWFHLIDSGLPPDTKQLLLSGQPVTLSFNQLPSDVQQAIIWDWQTMPDGSDQPAWVTIQIANDHPGWDTTWNVEKAIWIRIHNSTASPAVLHATGQSAWRWYKRWLLPEDAPSDPQELQPLPNGFPYQPQVTPLPPNPDPKTLAKLKPVTNCTLLDRMQEIAAKLHIPLLATLPYDPEQIYGQLTLNPPKTLADYLQGFSTYPEKWLYHKWNSGLLLVSYPRWPLDQAASLPEYLLQLLRKNLQQQGLFTLSLLRQLFAQMTPFQQHAFAQRFIPQADPQGHFPVFLFMLAHPELESASGMPLTPALTLEVENLHLPAYSAWHKEVFVALKVSVFDRDIWGRLMREFRLVGETTDQRWVPLEGILTGAVPSSFWQTEEIPQK